MIEFRTEPLFPNLIVEIKPLLRKHWHEIAHFKDHIPLDPAYGRYEQLEQNGNLLVCTVRADGALVGYSIFFLTRHPHYASDLLAANDILYLEPAYRRSRDGASLIRYSEAMCKAHGASWITWHVKDHFNFGPHLSKIGYDLIEHTYGKILKD